MCLQDLARPSFWQDRARASCKLFQERARPIVCKIEQEGLSSTCKNEQDPCLARLSEIKIDLGRLTKIDQVHDIAGLSKI